MGGMGRNKGRWKERKEEGFHILGGSYCESLNKNPVSDCGTLLLYSLGRLCPIFASPFVGALSCVHVDCGFLLQSNPICIPCFSDFFPDFWSTNGTSYFSEWTRPSKNSG